MEVPNDSELAGAPKTYPPEFRVAVQSKSDDGVHIIIHAVGHDGETLDLIVSGDEVVCLRT